MKTGYSSYFGCKRYWKIWPHNIDKFLFFQSPDTIFSFASFDVFSTIITIVFPDINFENVKRVQSEL